MNKPFYKSKRILVNTKKTKYVTVKMFAHKSDMQQFFKEWEERKGEPPTNWNKIQGAHFAYERIKSDKKLHPEIGTILYCWEHTGVGVVTHELLHAVMWSWRHKAYKKQYPFVINSMLEEERFCHNHTFATVQLYNWYWRIKPLFEKIAKPNNS